MNNYCNFQLSEVQKLKNIVVRASCSLEISSEQDARTPVPHKYENCYINYQ